VERRIIEKKIKEQWTINLLTVIVEAGTIEPETGNLLIFLFALHFSNIKNILSSLFAVVLLKKILGVTYNL